MVVDVGRTFRSAFGEAEAPPYVVRGKWWMVDGGWWMVVDVGRTFRSAIGGAEAPPYIVKGSQGRSCRADLQVRQTTLAGV